MRKRETSFFVKVAIFTFVVFAVITLVRLQFKANELEAQINEKTAENEALQEVVDQMENEKSSLESRDHIVEEAQDKLNLRLPEEIIFYNDLYN